jgi:hypothetical protein
LVLKEKFNPGKERPYFLRPKKEFPLLLSAISWTTRRESANKTDAYTIEGRGSAMGGCFASPSRVATPRGDEGEATFCSESWSPTYCVAFQSRQGNRKRPAYYLCRDVRSGGRSLLRLNGEGVANPFSRFYIEPSREHAGLVHIRCCYDNKYWVAEPHQNNGGRAIVGAADEAEEDLSKPTCTLFRIIRVPPHSIRYLCRSTYTPVYEN